MHINTVRELSASPNEVLTCPTEKEENESKWVGYGIMEMSNQVLLFLRLAIFIIHFYTS